MFWQCFYDVPVYLYPANEWEWDSMTHGNLNGFLFVYLYHRTWIARDLLP